MTNKGRFLVVFSNCILDLWKRREENRERKPKDAVELRSWPFRTNGHNGLRRSAHLRKRCKNCNYKYPKSSRFCSFCGSGNFSWTNH